MAQLRKRVHKPNELEQNILTGQSLAGRSKEKTYEQSKLPISLQLPPTPETKEAASFLPQDELHNAVKRQRVISQALVEKTQKSRHHFAYFFVILLAVSLFYTRQTLRYQKFAELTVSTSTNTDPEKREGVANLHIQLTGLRWEVPRGLFVRETDFFKRRKVVFVATAGRTGTGYLSKLFSLTENTVSLHEPWPRLEGKDLEKSLLKKGTAESSKEERKLKKMREIKHTLSGTSPATSYVETSHMFIKTMADFLLDELTSSEKFFILVLRRNLVSTINSQYSLGWFQPGHSGYRKWYYSIHDVSFEKRVLSPDRPEHEYDVIDRLIGYNLDIELRIQNLILYLKSEPRRYRNVQIIALHLESLNSTNHILDLLEQMKFNIEQKKIAWIEQLPRNERTSQKRKRSLEPLPEKWLRQRIYKFVRDYEQKGLVSTTISRQFLSNL